MEKNAYIGHILSFASIYSIIHDNINIDDLLLIS